MILLFFMVLFEAIGAVFGNDKGPDPKKAKAIENMTPDEIRGRGPMW